MNPSSIRRHLRSTFCACLITAAAGTLFNGLALRAAESSDVLPRYQLKPGQELKYHGQAEFKYGKNVNGLPRGSATDWRVWVARANANGSWRVIVSVSSRELPAAGKDSAQSEQPVDHQMALFDLFPDGHTLSIQASENTRVEPGKLFPRLPPDALAIKKGWADDREDGFVHCDYTADPQHTSGTEWAFNEDLQRAWDKIYDATTRTKFFFDRDRGLIQRAESELTWGNGFDEKGRDTIEFVAVKDHDESWTKSFAEEADRYFAAADAYHKQLSAAGHDADHAPEMLTKAETELKSTRANLTLTDFTEQLDKKLSEHKRQADYIAKEAKELAERKDKPAAEWKLDDLSGKSHALGDYRGKVVVLDFWYRGCGWCIRAMPQVQQLANDFNDQPVAVLGMNTDSEQKDAQFVVDAMQLSYPILKASGVPSKYGVHGFPTLVVIDQQGTVRDIHVGYSKTLRAEVSKIIKELLAIVRSSSPVPNATAATPATEIGDSSKPKNERLGPTATTRQATVEPGHAVCPVAVLRDDFNGKFALNWKIVRKDKDHISLTKDPGHLTIITQRGTIHGDVDHDAQSEGIRAKNIFLIRNPVSETSDFSITLAVSKFEPTTYYQQVSLLCYDDDANYVKWSFEYSWAKPDTTNFVMVRQTDKVPEHDLVTELKNPGWFWLRVTRRGTDYECAYSTDGDKFTVAGSRPWGKRPPKYVGFVAKNGGNPQAGEIDVSIDSFEVRSPPTAAAPARPAAPPAADSKPMAEAKAMPAAATGKSPADSGVQHIRDPQAGVLILDNCDDQYQGKDTYEDNLTFVDSSGNLVFRVSGFNNCESIGSNHMVAADSARGWIWVFENVGNRIHKIDRTGKELLVIKDVKGSALAVDAKTGNLWVVTSIGTIQGDKTTVFDPNGRNVATYDVSGWDIAYDRNAKSFWIAGPKLTKISAEKGDVSFVKDIAAWCSSCIALNPATGKVWVTIREHPEVANSSNELLGFDNDGTLQQRVPLGDKSPSHVSVDPQSGAVWVTNRRKSVQRYSVEGVLQAEYKMAALAAQVDRESNDVWVATPEEVVRMNPEGEILKRVKHKSKTSQVWIIGI